MRVFRWFPRPRRQPDSDPNGNGAGTTSHLLPTFVARLADPAIRMVFH
jgi:hypothetical protein